MDPLMTIWVFFIGSIIGIIIGVILSYRTAVNPLQRTIKKLTFQHEYSYDTMKYYPYNPDNFRFVGDPIDGVQFEENAILFVRFKKENTPRTKEQDHIKVLLENGNVEWFEFTTQ
jgi:predicted Holliday junction resolvase-like endonuclease